MRWTELFLGMSVLIGFWLLKLLAELVWEGVKARLRRELRSDPAPVPALPGGSADLAERPAESDAKPGDRDPPRS